MDYKDTPFIDTVSGISFYYDKPNVDLIRITDIAHALSNTCRYSGMCKEYYSVAEHSVLIAEYVLKTTQSKRKAIIALLHDAAEAYVTDLPKPLKVMLPGYTAIEARVEAVVAEKFGIPNPLPKWLKKLDSRILQDERDAIMTDSGSKWVTDRLKPLGVEIQCWTPKQARAKFLSLYKELIKE